MDAAVQHHTQTRRIIVWRRLAYLASVGLVCLFVYEWGGLQLMEIAVPIAAVAALFAGVPATLLALSYLAVGMGLQAPQLDGPHWQVFFEYTVTLYLLLVLGAVFAMTDGEADNYAACDRGGFRLGGVIASALAVYFTFGLPWPLAVPFYLLFLGWSAAYLSGWRYVKLGEATAGAGRGRFPAGGEDAKRPAPAKPRYTFEDVVGMDDLKARLLDAGRAAVAKRKGQGPAPRNGVLCYGEPGNGKSFFIEALAGEMKVNFIKIAVGDIASRWVNQSTEQLVAAFDAARAAAPAVLFIDEIDAILVRRENITQADSETGRLVNTFLTEMDKLRGERVLAVGATNLYERLDTAAVREGRFDFKIEIPAPDARAREAILEHALAQENPKLATEPETVVAAAGRWSGFSAARLTACAREAAATAARDKRAAIGFDDWMAAMRHVQGRRGQALPEGTPGLDRVVLAADGRENVKGVAYRMTHRAETEQRGGSVPTGLLFYGPPGTGKTLTAKALAKDTEWAFLPTSGTQLMHDDKAIDKLIQEAREIRPVIVFIDEADDILAARGGLNMNGGRLNQLLAAMDGAAGRVPDVLFIAATNRPEAMDTAALRGGRFSEKVLFDTPDAAMLDEYLAIWRKTHDAAFAPDLSRAEVAELLADLSFANVAAVLQAAINRMVSRGQADDAVSAADVIAARASVADQAF
jgi:transitional endoplasmic reticulum ATPase